MRRITDAPGLGIGGACRLLRRCSQKNGPIAVSGRSIEGSGEDVLSFSAFPSHHANSHPQASPKQTRDAHTISKFTEDAADGERVGLSPDASVAYPAKQQQRRRRRFPHTLAADSVHRREGGAAGEHSSHVREGLPVVYPGADLPPIPQRPLSEKRAGKFSFVSDPSQRASRNFYGVEVPNNTPKPKLPMWASSLTSPALGRVRVEEDSWISRDSRGVLEEDVTLPFMRWLRESVLPEDSVLRGQLDSNVLLDLRRATARGVYAKKTFKPGDVILTIPLTSAASADAASHVGRLTLNSETLENVSTASEQRVGMPSYETVKRLLSVQRSSFDPIPHPVFLDQVCAALRLACEKADGDASPLYPYLRLLSSAELFNDEVIEALHRDVLDPMTHMEYGDHVYRFRHYMRELHALWWAAYESAGGRGPSTGVRGVALGSEDVPRALGSTVPLLSREGECSDTVVVGAVAAANTGCELSRDDSNTNLCAVQKSTRDAATLACRTHGKPPPSLEDIEWALRIVLSRQKTLPHIRVHRTAFECIGEESVEGEKMDKFGRTVMRGKYAFYRHVLGALDDDRLHVNEVDPTAIPTVVPLLDMISHPPGGVPNISYAVETVQRSGESDGRTFGEDSLASRGDVTDNTLTSAALSYQVVVRATEHIEEDEELTMSYVKCYSVAYTLYRYGLLPLSRREDDVSLLLKANGLDGNMRPAPRNLQSSFFRGKVGVMSAVRRWWSSVPII